MVERNFEFPSFVAKGYTYPPYGSYITLIYICIPNGLYPPMAGFSSFLCSLRYEIINGSQNGSLFYARMTKNLLINVNKMGQVSWHKFC